VQLDISAYFQTLLLSLGWLYKDTHYFNIQIYIFRGTRNRYGRTLFKMEYIAYHPIYQVFIFVTWPERSNGLRCDYVGTAEVTANQKGRVQTIQLGVDRQFYGAIGNCTSPRM
jgi:hypothetical protein